MTGFGGYDAELRRHNEVLRRVCDVQFRDHVLDIGCGTTDTALATVSQALAGMDPAAEAALPGACARCWPRTATAMVCGGQIPAPG